MNSTQGIFVGGEDTDLQDWRPAVYVINPDGPIINTTEHEGLLNEHKQENAFAPPMSSMPRYEVDATYRVPEAPVHIETFTDEKIEDPEALNQFTTMTFARAPPVSKKTMYGLGAGITCLALLFCCVCCVLPVLGSIASYVLWIIAAAVIGGGATNLGGGGQPASSIIG